MVGEDEGPLLAVVRVPREPAEGGGFSGAEESANHHEAHRHVRGLLVCVKGFL